MKSLILSLIFLISFNTAQAFDFGFNGLSQSDVDDVFKEFAATLTHSTVTGAASKSKIFGFELGLVAGATVSDKVKDLVASTLPPGSDEVEYLPFASLYGLVSLPFGITVEGNYIPEVEVQDVDFSHLSLAGKWEFTSLFENSPVNLAVRGFLINSTLAVTQSTANFTGEVEFSQTQFGLQGVVSKSLPLIEPYAFIGLVSASGDLEAKGTGSIYGGSLTAQDKVDSDATSVQMGLGLQLNLLILKTGLEYVNSFGTSHVNAKLALSF